MDIKAKKNVMLSLSKHLYCNCNPISMISYAV